MAEIEKRMESELCSKIAKAKRRVEELGKIDLYRTSSKAQNLADLIGANDFEILQDTSDWNQHKNTLVDISGGMKPDIVIRSKSSGENRIIIEVKYKSPLTYNRVDSQVIRYFLHLLATTLQKKEGDKEIERALILAAPDSWFGVSYNHDDWEYFWRTYEEIASAFGITLGVIRLPEAP